MRPLQEFNLYMSTGMCFGMLAGLAVALVMYMCRAPSRPPAPGGSSSQILFPDAAEPDQWMKLPRQMSPAERKQFGLDQ